MERGQIGVPAGERIVPGKELAGFGLNGFADGLKAGRASVFDRVQINYRAPGSLAGVDAMGKKLTRAGPQSSEIA